IENTDRLNSDANFCYVVDETPCNAEESTSLHIVLPALEPKESWKDVEISPSISQEYQHKFQQLLQKFPTTFTDIPGRTTQAVHTIKLVDDCPIKLRPYNLPLHYQEAVEKEIDEMLRLGIIEPSSSPYSFPMVIVKKKDGNIRICIDYRKLNRVTVLDAENMPNIEDLFHRLAGAKYFTRLDLSKGYWQIPLAEDNILPSRHLEACFNLDI
ncbi:unnamed protein product, partial [Candidula unifasciata]